MFDLDIINQDDFYDLPMEAKALYFLLGMEADDEGFINPKKVLRLHGGNEDSVKLLIIKKYLIPFKSGVVVITDWKRNNYLQEKRIKPTIYQQEKREISYNNIEQKYQCLTNVKPMFNGCSESIEENSIEEYSITTTNNNVVVVNIFDFTEQQFGRTLSSVEMELLSSWEDNELTRYAIKQTVLNRKSSLNYTKGILNNFKMNNITTVLEAEEQQENFIKNKPKEEKKPVRRWL